MKQPYMPLMMGDYKMLTSGLSSSARGVFIDLWIHQYHFKYLPENIEELKLISPDLGLVWVFIERLFPIASPGRRQNPELEDTRAFWNKQAENGKKGGRPKKETQTIPRINPNSNPEANPNETFNNDLDLDTDLELAQEGVQGKPTGRGRVLLWLSQALDEITLQSMQAGGAYKGVNIEEERLAFNQKVSDSWEHYADHEVKGLRLAFNLQLKGAKEKINNRPPNSKPYVNQKPEGTNANAVIQPAAGSGFKSI